MLQKLAQSVIPKRNVSENQSADLVTSPLRTEIPKHYWLIGKIAPWVGLACFVLAFCLMTALGRAGSGVDNAVICSRYTTHTLLFTIAVLALGYFAFSGQRSPDRGEILGIIALIFAVWTVVTTTRHSTLLLAVAVLALGYLAVDRWHRSLENSPQMSVPIHREWEFCGLSKRK
jgi:hypothetical protein